MQSRLQLGKKEKKCTSHSVTPKVTAVLQYFTHSVTTLKPLLTSMNVSWKHTAQQYLYSNNLPTCAINITKIYCNVHTVYGSRNLKKFCSNEARWNTDSSCQNVKNIFVLAWGIICLQIISQTSALIKTVECINDLKVEVYDIPMVGNICADYSTNGCLPACHTVALSPMILWHLKHTISVVWRE